MAPALQCFLSAYKTLHYQLKLDVLASHFDETYFNPLMPTVAI